MFGGHNATTTFGDTWTRTGTTWTQQHPATAPPARVGAPMVYDPATNQLLLFGGSATPGSGFFSDTWTWNGTTWTQLNPATSPPPRRNGDMVYDAANGQVILFGGWNGSSLGDTWAWDGTTWTQLHPAASPSPRDSESLVYDPATQTAIMFGGFSPTSSRPGDTWSWDGTTWTKLLPPTSPGMTVVAWQAAYDTASNQLLLFGGDRGNTTPSSNLTWVWSGTTWTQLSPATSPLGRPYGTMTYDSVTKRIELFGGLQKTATKATYPSSTWNWNGTTWSQG